MRRRTFDLLASGAGLLIAIVLILAAALMTGAYTFVNNQVTTQLSEQKIFFAAAGSPALKALPPADQAAMTPYAGHQLGCLTGAIRHLNAELFRDGQQLKRK